MGASVSSHSSTIDDEIVQKVLDKLGSKAKGQGTEIEEELGVKSGEHASHGKTMAARSHVVEEPPKPDKRRILIKRKKEDEPTEGISSAPIVEGERQAQPAPSLTVPTPPSSAEHPGGGDPVDRSLPADEKPNEISPPAPLVAQQEVVPAKPTVAPSTIGVTTPEPVTGKKSMAFEAIEAEGQRDKLKKVRKTGRPRDGQQQQDVKLREDAARWQDLRAIPVQRRMIDPSMYTIALRQKSPNHGGKA